MAGAVYCGMVQPQSTLFGVSHKNITSKLTEDNWTKKATCRVHPDGILYIEISKSTARIAEKGLITIYTVCAHIADLEVGLAVETWDEWETFYSFNEDFSNLDEALKCANGEDEGELAKLSRPSEGSHEYPLERGGGIYITGFTRTPEGHLKSNFTVKVEDPTSNQD